MSEVGVDITNQVSQRVEQLGDVQFDLVITFCGRADEHCPTFSGKPKVIHVGFDDPPRLAKEAATEEEALDHFRRVRDEIRGFVGGRPENLPA